MERTLDEQLLPPVQGGPLSGIINARIGAERLDFLGMP